MRSVRSVAQLFDSPGDGSCANRGYSCCAFGSIRIFVGSKSSRIRPSSVRTRDNAVYAMPAWKMLAPHEITARSNVRDCDLWMVIEKDRMIGLAAHQFDPKWREIRSSDQPMERLNEGAIRLSVQGRKQHTSTCTSCWSTPCLESNVIWTHSGNARDEKRAYRRADLRRESIARCLLLRLFRRFWCLERASGEGWKSSTQIVSK